MSTRVALLVEGQTEEAFVSQILQPHVGWESAALTPIVVHTSRAASGEAHRGGGRWHHYRDQLRNLLAQPHWSMITTMIDFYAYPVDAPQCDCLGSQHIQPGCVESRERAMSADLPFDSRFRPFIMLHEFEALIIAAGAERNAVLDSMEVGQGFRDLLDAHGGDAETINSGVLTAPSKRVQALVPGYRKVRDSIAILDSGLDVPLRHTPRFAAWTRELADA